ncbi:MAG: ATP phosphoribosyltransferase [Bdellovibrionaceae bacterium]|nr:ATP phosphoribosyltransferase [Pseudobdellovibrionaceae bacterium]
MNTSNRLRIAIQKSGRLAEKSISLFMKCGLDFELHKNQLFQSSANFPIDLMLVRDDDIPGYVADGVCDLGIVGENILKEKVFSRNDSKPGTIEMLHRLDFGYCRLSMAVPPTFNYINAQSLEGTKIATSYPSCLSAFLAQNNVKAEILELGGSVEIAPVLSIADVICDLVSTGSTLRSNGLTEVATLFESQACLVRTGKSLSPEKIILLERLLQRIQGVLTAGRSKYIMMNAPKEALPQSLKILPGMEEPSIMPLGMDGKKVAIHAVASEDIFWETIENLKKAGANSILVLPIEKVIA